MNPRFAVALSLALAPLCRAQDEAAVRKHGDTAVQWATYEPEGPSKGKYIVFVTGDEEYRSEEGMPQLAKILAKHHGFRCSVHFAVDEETGEIDPNVRDNIPGLENLAKADLMVVFTRFRDLPEDQMKHIAAFTESGKPMIGLRTATHAFNMKKDSGPYWHYSFRNQKWDGGWGRQVLGETWIAHHGGHKSQSTRGLPAEGMADHPILRGIAPNTIWDPSDVYTVRLPMMEGIEPLVMGQVLDGMQPDSPPAKPRKNKKGAMVDKNDPMMPVAWLRTYETKSGSKARVFGTTLGASQAFTQEGSRRLLVNACYWALGLDVPERAKVDLVGTFAPTMFGFNAFTKGIKPADHIAAATGGGGFAPMFDGATLRGWTQRNGTATYRVEGDCIVGRTTPGSPNSFLCTDKSYGDFEMTFEVKVDDELNSGVQIRSTTRDGPQGRVNGPQVEIEASGSKGAEAGYIYGEASGGWMTPKNLLKPHKHFKDGEWNSYRILAVGPRIRTWVNGVPISDLVHAEKFATHPTGFIGLQVHGVGKRKDPLEVRWRKLMLREIRD